MRLLALTSVVIVSGCALHVTLPEVPTDNVVIVLCVMARCEIPERRKVEQSKATGETNDVER